MNFQKKRNKMWKKAKRIFFNQLFKYVLLLLFIHCHVQLFFDRMDCRFLCPWDFPRQEYWSGLPFPSPGDLTDPGIKPASPAWQAILYHRASWEAQTQSKWKK